MSFRQPNMVLVYEISPLFERKWCIWCIIPSLFGKLSPKTRLNNRISQENYNSIQIQRYILGVNHDSITRTKISCAQTRGFINQISPLYSWILLKTTSIASKIYCIDMCSVRSTIFEPNHKFINNNIPKQAWRLAKCRWMQLKQIHLS